MAQEPVHFSITPEFIATRDAYDILEPVGWSIAAHGQVLDLDTILAGLRSQAAECHTLLWYGNEVDNGGHAQFFANVPVELWYYAYQGLDRLDLQDLSINLLTAMDLIGTAPAEGLADLPEDAFSEHDEAFYTFEREPPGLEEVILAYIRAHPEWFLFEGVVMKDVD